MKLSLPEKSRLVSSYWKDAPSLCPKHDVPMRTFFVERVYKPQVVMVCPKGEMFRFDQKPKQIEFSRPHLKTMVLDAQEREAPACSQDFTPLVVYRTPAVFIPQGWDYTFVCPTCLSYGRWMDTGRPDQEGGGPAFPRRNPTPSQANGDGEGGGPFDQALRRDGADRLHRVRLRLRGVREGARRRQREGPEPLRSRQGRDRARGQ